MLIPTYSLEILVSTMNSSLCPSHRKCRLCRLLRNTLDWWPKELLKPLWSSGLQPVTSREWRRSPGPRSSWSAPPQAARSGAGPPRSALQITRIQPRWLDTGSYNKNSAFLNDYCLYSTVYLSFSFNSVRCNETQLGSRYEARHMKSI